MNHNEKKEIILNAISETKGEAISILDVGELSSVADTFIIASGRVPNQVKGIANAVDDELSKRGIEPLRKEGLQEGRWVVMDYDDIIVHIFHEEIRTLYALEQLWTKEGLKEKEE